MIFTLCCKLAQHTSLCVSFAYSLSDVTSFKCYGAALQYMWFSFYTFFSSSTCPNEKSSVQGHHMDLWYSLVGLCVQNLMNGLSSSTCGNSQLWDTLLLFLVYFEASAWAHHAGCFVESFYKSLWVRLFWSTRTQSWVQQIVPVLNRLLQHESWGLVRLGSGTSQTGGDIMCDRKGRSFKRYIKISAWEKMIGKAHENKWGFLARFPKTFSIYFAPLHFRNY